MTDRADDRAEEQDAQFECGCWFRQVGVQRHPAITGDMCCPIHLKPYKAERQVGERLSEREIESLRCRAINGLPLVGKRRHDAAGAINTLARQLSEAKREKRSIAHDAAGLAGFLLPLRSGEPLPEWMRKCAVLRARAMEARLRGMPEVAKQCRDEIRAIVAALHPPDPPASPTEAERLKTACFNAGHFPNPVGHSVVGCEICEALIAFRAADSPASPAEGSEDV